MNEGKNRILAIIPARGGSKRIPRKNLKLLSNKPLIGYTIDAALLSRNLTCVIVSTDDLEIAEYVKTKGVDIPFMRPSELAVDSSSQYEVIIHALKNIDSDFDVVALLQPTSPFRTHEHIDEAIELFDRSHADTVTSVCPVNEHPYYMWRMEGDELKPFLTIEHQAITRQELPPVFVENGAIYITKKSVIDSGKLYGNRIIPYMMDYYSSIDIDTYEDLEFSEFLIKKMTGL